MKEKLERAKKIIEKYWQVARFGIYNTPNIVGDNMDTIYNDAGLTVLICYRWGYFEVFGLSTADFGHLEKYYNKLRGYT